MITDSRQLGAFLHGEARLRRLMVSFDTHHNAENWEISWWRGNRRHRVDFQPMPGAGLHVTHYQDHIPRLPGPFARLLEALGLFRGLMRTEWTVIAATRFPIEEAHVVTIVTECLSPAAERQT